MRAEALRLLTENFPNSERERLPTSRSCQPDKALFRLTGTPAAPNRCRRFLRRGACTGSPETGGVFPGNMIKNTRFARRLARTGVPASLFPEAVIAVTTPVTAGTAAAGRAHY